MKKLMMVAIGMVACSMMTGCKSGTSASSKGGTYANLPNPRPDEFLIHWEQTKNERITTVGTVCGGMFGFCGESDEKPWMLRDQESFGTFGIRNYSHEARARNAALYKACQQEGCDALIGAMYEVKVESYGPFFSQYTCTVKGWPARITGIEKVANKK